MDIFDRSAEAVRLGRMWTQADHDALIEHMRELNGDYDDLLDVAILLKQSLKGNGDPAKALEEWDRWNGGADHVLYPDDTIGA